MHILYVTTVGLTMGFFKSFIGDLLAQGHTVDIACNETEFPVDDFFKNMRCKVHPLSCSRSPLKLDNLRAVREIRQLVSDTHYDIVHCHTPVAAACTRLACRKARRTGTKVIYTAHGFHFYKGAPLKNWLMYYPVEKLCAHLTDTLITINKEDYALAQKKLHAKRVEYVPGVGIDVAAFANTTVDRAAKRTEIGVPADAFLLLSVGELNENKNHETVIRAVAAANDKKLHYAIAGRGARYDALSALAEALRIDEQVHLIGYREDIAELYKVADTFMHPSFREGLPVSVTEAMASGLPVIASRIRGNTDLVRTEYPMLCNPHSVSDFTEVIRLLMDSPSVCAEISRLNAENALPYDTAHINRLLQEIYLD